MFKSSLVALITPYDPYGNVDLDAYAELVNWHIQEGTDGLILCGSTGEGALLSKQEKLDLFQVANQVGSHRITLIGSTGTCQTHESVHLTEEAQRIGLDGCIAIVPYYVRPEPEGLILHFTEIAKVGLPLCLYHHPGRTGTKLNPAILKELVDLPGIVSIKDASGDFPLAKEFIPSIPHYSGDDCLALQHLLKGFSGSISIIGNVIPKMWKEFVDCAIDGRQDLARDQFSRLYPLCQALVMETNPQCVKYAMHLLGKCSSDLRLPLVQPREETKMKIKSELRSCLLDQFSNETCPSCLM